MRSFTISDGETLARAEALARARGVPVADVVREALRAGLDQISEPYRTQPHSMGVRPGYSLDGIQELLARVEGEASR